MKLQFQVIQVLVVLQFEHLIDQCLSSRLDIGRRVFSTRPSPPPPSVGCGLLNSVSILTGCSLRKRLCRERDYVELQRRR